MREFPKQKAARLVRAALAEDIDSGGDITSQALIPAQAFARAVLMAKADGIIAGLPILPLVFGALDKRVEIKLLARDGQRIRRGQRLAELRGPARALLTGERTALNFLQRLSGIATLTRKFVAAVPGRRKGGCHRCCPNATAIQILDTRKTTPALRVLEKYAVACGGGANHRFGLHDQILIKDNHLKVLSLARAAGAGRREGVLTAAIRAARASHPRLPVEIETATPAEAAEAAAAGADIIMLDNFRPAQIPEAIKRIAAARLLSRGIVRKKQEPRTGFTAAIEISGGVTLANIGQYAAAIRAALRMANPPLRSCVGISTGALTHSAPALDLSLEVEA